MLNLLIAEDEVIERETLLKTIKTHYHEDCVVFTANNGLEAMDIYRRNHIDICILDIEMPGITGIEVAQTIRKQKDTCTIIFLTAFDSFSYAKKAINVHALEYLLKPYDEAELFAALDEAIQIHLNTAPLNRFLLMEPEATNHNSKYFLTEEIVKYIQQNYQRDIPVAEIAAQVHYSEAYFCTFFKENFNQTFTLYLNSFRIKRAIELFKDHRLSIKEISSTVGFTDQNYFTKVFKRLTGVTPSLYRQRE